MVRSVLRSIELVTGVLGAAFRTLAAIRYALRRFLRFSEKAAEAVGLTPQQHQALLTIKGFPGREYVTNGEWRSNVARCGNTAR